VKNRESLIKRGINMYLISAYFDEETNKVLDDYIKRVASATANDFYIANKVPAHLTLLAIEAKSVEELIPSFEKLEHCGLRTGDLLSGPQNIEKSYEIQKSGKLESGEISIVTVGQLMPRVIYLAPFINEYLFNLQKSIYEAFMCLADVKISNYYKPYSWLPHITIGKTLTKEQMLKAVEVMQDFKSLNARIVKIGLAKVNPHEDVRKILFHVPAMN